jgi:hypothetical protein
MTCLALLQPTVTHLPGNSGPDSKRTSWTFWRIPRGLATSELRGQYPKRSGNIRATRSVSQEVWLHQSCEVSFPRGLVTSEPRGQYPKKVWLHQSHEASIPRGQVTPELRGQYPKRSGYTYGPQRQYSKSWCYIGATILAAHVDGDKTIIRCFPPCS